MAYAITIEPAKSQIATIEVPHVIPYEAIKNFIDTYLTGTGLGAGLYMYVDDEGLLQEDNDYFTFKPKDGPGTLYAGKALICAIDHKGDSIAFPKDVADVIIKSLGAMVVFLGKRKNLPKAIAEGTIHRPVTTFTVPGKDPETLWEFPDSYDGKKWDIPT